MTAKLVAENKPGSFSADGKLDLSDAGKEMTVAIYYQLDEDGAEVTTTGTRYAVVSYKETAAGNLPVDALLYDDIVAGLTSTTIAGFNGHIDVALATPTAVVYSKTKAFTNKAGENNVYASMRFYF
jgi:hypothetical protein